MLKLLLKKQLLESFRGFFVNQKKNTGRAREVTIALILLYALLLVGVIGGFVGFLAYSLCSPLAEAGLLWLYHAIFALIALLLGVFGSVFNTFAGLYKGKDNDLLLSLPIPVRYILASRLLGVYLLGLMFSAAVLLPAYLVRVIFGGFSAPALFGGLLLILLVSLVVFVLSCLLGWVVAKISAKLKNKSFITVFLALGFIALYYVVYFKGLDVFNEMIANPEGIDGEGIKGKAYLFYLLGQIGEGKPLACLVYSLVIFAAVVLTCFVLDRTFIKIATTASAATTKKAYVEKRIAMRPLWLTALLREAKRFTSNAGYMLNTGLSTILAPALGIFLLVKGEDYAASLLAREGVTPALIGLGAACLICFAASMNTIAAPSVSLEGAGIDVIRSLPVPTKTVLLAKAGNHLLFTLPPVLLTSLFTVVALRSAITPGGAVTVFVLPAAFTLFTAFYDLTIGLLTPNLHWTNEMTVIKQGAGMLIAAFSGMIFPLLAFVAALTLPLPALALGLLLSGVFLAAAIALYFAVTTWGVQTFENLS